MGYVIGLACSMLLGKTQADRKRIQENIVSAFSLRNKIVHGSDFEWKQFTRLLPNLEEYVRKTLLILRPPQELSE